MRKDWLERVWLQLQEWRHANVGIAFTVGGATFGVLWTISGAAGIPGSKVLILLLLHIASLAGFSTLLVLQSLLHKKQLALRTSVSSFPATQAARSRTIGVVAPISFWSTDYYVQIVRAIRSAADREKPELQRKIVVLDVPHEEFVDVEQTMTDIIINQLSGLIMINIKINSLVRQQLISTGIPVINVNHEDKQVPSVCSVLPDHTGFADLVQHLLVEKKVIAAILITKALQNPFKGVKEDKFRKEKRDIFVAEARKTALAVQAPIQFTRSHLSGSTGSSLQIELGKAYVIEIEDYLAEFGGLLVRRLVDPVPPNTAFVFLADIVAISFLVECSRHGRSALERRFRVTGFDNSIASAWFNLSSVDYQLDVVGRIAYDKLQLALDHPGDLFSSVERVSTRPVIRESSNWR